MHTGGMIAVGGAGGLGVELLVTLTVAAAVALIAQRLRLAAAPAFLIAGVLAGPASLGLVSSPDNLSDIGQIATVLLLFGVGLEMRFSRTGAWREGARLSAAGVLACAGFSLIGWPVAVLFGLTPRAAIAVSMAFSLSSTALVLRTLSTRRELRRPHGRAALAVLIVQDLAALVILAALPLLAAQRAGSATDLIGSAALSLSGVAALVVVGKLLAGRLLREAARGPEGAQLMTIVAVVMAVGAGVATQRLRLSPELGAFLAGFLLADTPFRHQIAGAVAPMRDVLIAVFFTSVGMRVDPALALQYAGPILAATAALVAIKTLTTALPLYALGLAPAPAATVGLMLAHAGEFSLVVLTVAQTTGVISPTVLSLGITVTVLSLLLTPMMNSAAASLAPSLSAWPMSPLVRRGSAGTADEPTQSGHVIIAGFGPVGRVLADKLSLDGVPFTVIELNPDTVSVQERAGRRIIYGDASNPEVLESAGVHHAAALALAIPDDDAVVRACSAASRLAPEVFIVARTSSLGKGNLARSAGAHDVVIEEITAAEYVRRAVTDHIGASKSG